MKQNPTKQYTYLMGNTAYLVVDVLFVDMVSNTWGVE